MRKLRWVTLGIVAACGLLVVGLQLASAGAMPKLTHLTEFQRQWQMPILFALTNLAPFYALFRFAAQRSAGPRDLKTYLGGSLVLLAIALLTRSYAYSFELLLLQVLLCSLVWLLAWSIRERRRGLTVAAVAASLAASFFINWAIAPWAYVVDGDAYFGPDMPADIRGHLEYFYWIWDDPGRKEAAHKAMREQNPEWDMISRTFLAYSLANVALQYPAEKERALKYLDRVIDDTVKVPWMNFLLPYGHETPFFRKPPSSVMVDGEVSLMIGLRRLVEDPPDYPHRALHRQLVDRCIASMKAGPVLCGECYPDECWLWCNPLALTSAKVLDVLEGTDHSDFFRQWEQECRKSIVDKPTGLIPSAIQLDGEVIHPPEGSTIWVGASCLLPVCPEFAREQYARMKELLAGRLLFLAYGREWPKGKRGEWDIDSGFTPFGMGPASTGFALVASKEMGDRDFFARLVTLLNLVGVPSWEEGRMRYLSSNLVGDATFLFAKTTGPAWKEIARRDALRKKEAAR